MKKFFRLLLIAMSLSMTITSCGPSVTLKVLDAGPLDADVEITYSGVDNSCASEIIMHDTFGRDRTYRINLDGEKGCDTIKLSGLKPNSHVYMGYVLYTEDPYESDVVEFTTGDIPNGAVDLGLSVKWASQNLGADDPFDRGDFFAWGETAPKDHYSLSTYSYKTDFLETTDNPKAAYNLPPERDAATVNLKDGWRMPTKEEFTELCEKCEWDFVDDNHPYWVVKGANGNFIILPMYGYAADGMVMGNQRETSGHIGHYWASTSFATEEPSIFRPYYSYMNASGLYLSNKGHYTSSHKRTTGANIRPVKE